MLVLEQDGHTDHIYVGSATEAAGGITSRFAAYDRFDRHAMPLKVIEAVDNGYTITSKGLLATAPIPTFAFIPVLRTLLVAMEAVFTFVFWAVTDTKHGTGDYGMGAMCL